MKRLALIALLLTLTGCAGLHTTALKARDIAGLPSLQEVLPGVYAGDWGDARRVDDLKAHGIKLVLNVAQEINDPPLGAYVIMQAKAGMVDWDDANNEAKVQAAMDLLDRWYEGASDAPRIMNYDTGEHIFFQYSILVHCQGGRNRTLYVLSRWWARRTGQRWQDVANEIQAKRPEMALHGWMLKQGPK